MNTYSKSSKIFLAILGIVIVLGLAGLYLFKEKIGSINVPSSAPLPASTTSDESLISYLSLPEGFKMNIFAKDLPGARVIEFDPKGRIIVSQTGQGKIISVRDTDGDGVADERKTIAEGLNNPHGLAFRCDSDTCSLYVAESDQLSSFDYDGDTATLSNKKKLADISSSASDRHFTRTLLFLPYPDEDKLLISVGSSCDVCLEGGSQHAKILQYDLKTGSLEEYARGLRNSVFMALHPVDGGVWATEMGRDGLGDDIPPDEINIIEKGKNYGWPICYGQNIHDDDFDKNTYIRNPCMSPFETPSHIDLPAHSAPLGLSFIPEEGWPEDMWHHLLVAHHGSWNRSEPTGYKIVRIKLDTKGNYLGTEDFITGWLTKDGKKLGRPVDIKVLPGGTIYITDDDKGFIYRLSRSSAPVANVKPPAAEHPMIRVQSPLPNAIVGSPLTIKGEARGYWYFEASFPVRLFDADGKQIQMDPPYVMTSANWMTEEFVPFETMHTFAAPVTGTGTLVLEKDNPSGLPEHDDKITIPVRFSP